MSLRRELDFLLNGWLACASLLQRERFADHSLETFAAVLDTCEKIAREKYAPFNRLVDTQEPRVVDDGEANACTCPRRHTRRWRRMWRLACWLRPKTLRSAACNCLA